MHSVRLQSEDNLVELPRTRKEVLVRIVKSMGTNQSIYLVDDNQTVTTSVVLSTLVSPDSIVFVFWTAVRFRVTMRERTGVSTLNDVRSYMNRRTTERKAALDSMPVSWLMLVLTSRMLT